MRTLLPIDPALGGYTLSLDPPLTDAQLFEFCQLNDVARVERTKEGVIRMMSPAGTLSGDGSGEIHFQLRHWWKTHRRGRVYDSSTGFYLPDGSMLSPDSAYCMEERLRTVTMQDREGFAHVCPDFVIELLSKTDRLTTAKRKMELWVENGARVAWLVDPKRREVLIYRRESETLVVSGSMVEGSGPVEGFRLDVREVWKCYEE